MLNGGRLCVKNGFFWQNDHSSENKKALYNSATGRNDQSPKARALEQNPLWGFLLILIRFSSLFS